MDYSNIISAGLSETSPCGENLDDDNLFCNFLLSSEGTQERSRGDTIIPASPPDWRLTKKNALEFLKSTKHLRLTAILAQSVLNLEGVPSFSSCLAGIASLLEEQWDFVYPLVDLDGDSNAEKVMERISALSLLTHGRFIIDTLRDIPLANNRVMGPLSLRTILSSTNSASDSKPELDQLQISSIFRDDNQEKLSELLRYLVSCQNSLTRIQNSFLKFNTESGGVDFAPLNKILQSMVNSLEKYGNFPQQNKSDGITIPENVQGVQSPEDSASNSRTLSEDIIGVNKSISSRQDVEIAIERICDYYKKYEPSSPLPILLLRAKKLVHLDFIQILKDMAPESLESVYKIGGITEDLEDNDN